MLNFFSLPSFWLFISFSFFLFLIVRPLAGIVISNLDYYRNTISEQLEESKKAREEAEAFLKEAQDQRKIVKDKSELIINNTLKEGKCLNDDSRRRLLEFLKNEEKRTEANVSRLESDSINRLQEKVFDISFSFSKKVLSDLILKSEEFRSSLNRDVLNKIKDFEI